MSRKSLALGLPLTAWLVLWPYLAAGKDPGGPLTLLASSQESFDLATVAPSPDGSFLLAWSFPNDGVFTQRFRPDGASDGPRFQIAGPESYSRDRVTAAADGDGYLVVWDDWHHYGGPTSFAHRLEHDGPVAGPNTRFSRSAVGGVAVGATGVRLAATSSRRGVVVHPLDERARRQGPHLRLAELGAWPRIVATSNGFAATWRADDGHFLQRLDAKGRPVGLPRRVARLGTGEAALAANGRDRLALAWFESHQLYAQVFGEDGRAKTGKLLVDASAHPFNSTGHAVAIDREGKLVVSWGQRVGADSRVLARRFEASGEPAGRAVVASETDDCPYGPDLALAPDGTFLWTWIDGGASGNAVLLRRLGWARAGTAACVFRAGRFLCDVARDGGDEERLISFGTAGDFALLGDLDGDGRDDPCVARAGVARLLCDTAHDGATAEVDLAFSLPTLPGDVPLLGDVDGEGRDDFCLLRGAQLLCDTAHNGGTAEVVVPAAASPHPALLGDLDGDGDDELCRIANGLLACDTEHDGGRAEVVIPFILSAGDIPLSGDMDRDGRDDPCLYRAGRFLCDTAHDGGSPELVLRFGGAPGDLPLLGDLENL